MLALRWRRRPVYFEVFIVGIQGDCFRARVYFCLSEIFLLGQGLDYAARKAGHCDWWNRTDHVRVWGVCSWHHPALRFQQP